MSKTFLKQILDTVSQWMYTLSIKEGRDMKHRTVETATIQIERNEDEFDIRVDGYVEFSTENSWGEDADGNRGVRRTFITDITDISAYNCDDEDITKTLSEEELDLASEALGDKFFRM